MSKKAYKNLRWQINNWPRYPISKLCTTRYISFFFFFFFFAREQFWWPLSANDTPASSLNFDWVNQGPTQLSALASISRSTDICGSRWSTRSEPPHQVTYIYTLYILLISGPVKGSNTTLSRIFDRCRIHSFLTFCTTANWRSVKECHARKPIVILRE
jgi:hypothetical protein